MPSERGAVTAYAASFAVLLSIAALVLTQMAGLVRLRHSVAASADLAALAATRASVSGADACAAGREIARLNGARLVTCRMDYDVATVTARGTSRAWWGHRWTTEQEARAAPDYYVSD